MKLPKDFKLFKRNQKKDESTNDYMGQLRKLAKTRSFGAYLETALRYQFVCRLRDVKCQRELLCEATLTAETALKKASAAEVVLKETEGMQAAKNISTGCTTIATTSTVKGIMIY